MNEPSGLLQPPGSAPVWYCVRTRPKQEHFAAARLACLEGVEVFAPRIRFRRRTRRGRVWFEESLFPGYVFARFDLAQSVRAVSAAFAVSGLVRFGGECARVPEAVIQALQAEFADRPLVIPDAEPKPGDAAVVISGALCGLRAIVTQVLPGGERVKILMELMGTAVQAEVPIDSLEPAA